MNFRKASSTSNIERIVLLSTDGTPRTGLVYNSGSLVISTICDNEATATTYTSGGSTTETISTLGTYSAPTATKCRFREVDSTNHPGLYEIQLANARYAVSNAKYLDITITCSGTLLPTRLRVRLTQTDADDAVRGGMTALPNTAVTTNGSLITSGTSTDQLSVTSGLVKISSGTGTGQLSITSGVVSSNMTQIAGDATSATNLSTSAKTMEVGTAVTGTLSSTVFTTSLTNATDGAYVGRIVVFTSGALIRQVGVISGYVGSTKKITVSSAFTTAPSNADGLIVV